MLPLSPHDRATSCISNDIFTTLGLTPFAFTRLISLAMRLLSFLTDIEKALIAESPVIEAGAWETTRMVNFHHGLARLTMTPRSGNELPNPGGAIFVQAFVLADGSQCVKASLSWKGCEAFPVMAVYSTPSVNWKLEASRIAGAWLEGPPALATVTTTDMHAGQALPALSGMAS